MQKRFVVLATTALLAGTAHSVAAANSIRVLGAGSQGCGVWLQHTVNTDPTRIEMGSWVDGYLTARNEALSVAGRPADLGHTTDSNGRDAWITTYCQSHPLEVLYVAAKALADDLEKTGR